MSAEKETIRSGTCPGPNGQGCDCRANGDDPHCPWQPAGEAACTCDHGQCAVHARCGHLWVQTTRGDREGTYVCPACSSAYANVRAGDRKIVDGILAHTRVLGSDPIWHGKVVTVSVRRVIALYVGGCLLGVVGGIAISWALWGLSLVG